MPILPNAEEEEGFRSGANGYPAALPPSDELGPGNSDRLLLKLGVIRRDEARRDEDECGFCSGGESIAGERTAPCAVAVFVGRELILTRGTMKSTTRRASAELL